MSQGRQSKRHKSIPLLRSWYNVNFRDCWFLKTYFLDCSNVVSYLCYYCCDKHHGHKRLGEGRVSISSPFPGSIPSLSEVKAGVQGKSLEGIIEVEVMKGCKLLAYSL